MTIGKKRKAPKNTIEEGGDARRVEILADPKTEPQTLATLPMVGLPESFTFYDAVTADEIVKRNAPEFTRWAFAQAILKPDTYLGAKMALLLAQKTIPDTSRETARSERLFRELAKVPLEMLRKIEAAEISPEDINFSSGQVQVEDEQAEQAEAEQVVKPIPKARGQLQPMDRPAPFKEKKE